MTRGIFVPDEPPRRRWWRLHLSTWLLLGLVAIALTLIVAPGELRRCDDGDGYRFGWPLVYRSELRGPSGPPPRPFSPDDDVIAPWTFPDAWEFTDSGEWHLGALAVDLLSCAALLAIVGLGSEWRRRKRQRWYQFTLREMLLLTLLVAAALGYNIAANTREQRIVQRLPTSWHFSRRNTAPEWLHRLVGRRHLSAFDRITNCSIQPPTDTREETEHVAEQIDTLNDLRHLRSLQVWEVYNPDPKYLQNALPALGRLKGVTESRVGRPSLTDADLVHFYRLEQLEELSVRGKQVTDLGLRELLKHRPSLKIQPTLHEASLKSIRLGGRVVDLRPATPREKPTSIIEFIDIDAPQMHLERLDDLTGVTQANLKNLTLTPTDLKYVGHCRELVQLTLEDIRYKSLGESPPPAIETTFLSELTELRLLDLRETAIGDDGLPTITSLKRLETLELTATGVTEAGLPQLRALPNLRTLWLGRNPIGDDAAPALKEFGELETLYLEIGQFSRRALADLRRSLPKCKIIETER